MKTAFSIFGLAKFILLVIVPFEASARVAAIDGYCYLHGDTDHSGTRVLFEGITPSAQTDSSFTDETGEYSIGLSEGVYRISYSHSGYDEINLPGEFIFYGQPYTLPEQTLYPELTGPLSGALRPGVEYHVNAEITVAAQDTLVVYPGTVIKFMGNYALEVFGTLLANGSLGDSISFTSGQDAPAPGDWYGIQFSYSASEMSTMKKCTVEYAYEGISLDNTNPEVSEIRSHLINTYAAG